MNDESSEVGLYRHTLDSVALPVWLISRDESVYCNQAACTALGYENPQQLLPNLPAYFSPEFQPCGTPSKIKALKMIEIAETEGFNQFSWIHRSKDHTDNEFEVTLVRLADKSESGKSLMVCSWRNLNVQRDIETRLYQMATTDAITGIKNRKAVERKLVKKLNKLGEAEDSLACIIVDIDRLNRVNSAFGYSIGDSLLYLIAQRLQKLTGDTDLIGRFSGDEFAVLITNPETLVNIVEYCDQLRNAMEEEYLVGGHRIVVTLSMGVSMYPRDGDSGSALLAGASYCLKKGRRQGGRGVFFSSRNVSDDASEWMKVRASIRKAVGNHELELHYQPQVNAQTGRIEGVEALVRWHHPEFGMIPPGKFIPVAEESGEIGRIGEWVFAEACSQLNQWHQSGHSDLRMAVNVSVQQLGHGTLMPFVRDTLAKESLKQESVELEITESLLLEDEPLVEGELDEILTLGLRLSLDDFGTSYSSLTYMNKYEFSVVKIDQSFVRGLISEPRKQAIVKAVIALGKGLDITVIGEGIESKSEAISLRNLGCDLLQGYYLGKPMPATEMTKVLKDHDFRDALEVVPDGRKLILYVDDSGLSRRAFAKALEFSDITVLTTGSITEAFDLLATHAIRVVVSDQVMPELNGTELLSRVSKLYPNTLGILTSGLVELEQIAAHINQGTVFKFLTKPWRSEDLIREIQQALLFQEILAQQTKIVELEETDIAG